MEQMDWTEDRMKENYWSFMKDDLLSVQSIEDN